MILVTGGSGFVGSHLIYRLMSEGHPVCNVDPRTPDRSLTLDEALALPLTAVMHLGAISDTTCEDVGALTTMNVELSIELSRFCGAGGIPLIYASSASVYGNGNGPLNAYAQSKWEFDDVMMTGRRESPWYGLRFFNVYGAGEEHKGKQASMVYQLLKEMREQNTASIFDIEAKRDFVHVSDVVSVMLWMWKNRPASGIYDVGTGIARDFEDIIYAAPVTGTYLLQRIPMPYGLASKYQFHTQAALTKLRAAGYTKEFLSLEQGIAKMMAS